MRQILYASLSTTDGCETDLSGILQQSRHNNALDGITGLLWSDGLRFLQVFEGPRASVEATFTRIVKDARHHSIDLLSDRAIDARDFGTWTMEHRRDGDAPDDHDWRLRRLLGDAAKSVQAQFLSLLPSGCHHLS